MMFEKATKKLVQQIDPKGALIAVSSPNVSEKLKPLGVVLKSPKRWFWQQIKYSPTSFTLDDLLKGDEIKPVCVEDEFVRYSGTYRNSMAGSVEVGGPAVSLNAKGQGTSKLSLSLGTLKKEYVHIPNLLKDSTGRMLDMTHPFIRQCLKRNETFTLLKERIFTTCECIISYTETENSGCHALFGGLCTEISLEGQGKHHHGSESEINIPPNTVLAYSVIEINIDSDGYFELALVPFGLEADDTSENPFPIYCEIDGQPPLIQEGFPISTLKNALADAQPSFCALADLSADSRSSTLLQLRKILLDRSILPALVDRLEALSSDEASCFSTTESENHSQVIDEFVDLLKCESLENNGHSTPASLSSSNGCHTSASHQNGCSTKASKQKMKLMYAMKMLISALEELTDTGLNLLEPYCTSDGLKSLQELVIHLTSNCMLLGKDTFPVFLQRDDEFNRVEELFKCCNVLLKKEKDTLTSEMTCSEGFLPVVLCVAIHGLASLGAA